MEHEQEIYGFLKQSHISDKNMARLQTLAASPDPSVAELASLVTEIGRFRPHKMRRLKVLARERRDLLDALERTGLIHAHQQ